MTDGQNAPDYDRGLVEQFVNAHLAPEEEVKLDELGLAILRRWLECESAAALPRRPGADLGLSIEPYPRVGAKPLG
ncbi:MAG TPA: hypothetical protein VGG86_00280 [Roseiarcus sp.]